MAKVSIRKARSESSRHVAPGMGAGMALLTKQDFEDLRSHAISSSAELPRPQPMRSEIGSSVSVGNAPQGTSLPMPGAGMGNSAGSERTRWTGPKVERRVRSASSRRTPGMSKLSSEPMSAVAIRRTCDESKRQVLADCSKIMQSCKDHAAIMQRVTVEPPPSFRVQKSLGGAVGTGSSGNGGRAGGSTRSRSDSRGPAPSPPLVSSNAALRGPGASIDSLCIAASGFEPKRLPRPADIVLKAVETGLANGKAVVALTPAPPLPLQGLEVSGLAAPVCSQSVPETAGNCDALADWSSSDEEDCATEAEAGDNFAFDYRDYRYQRYQEVRARAAPPEQQRRGLRIRRPAHVGSKVRGDSSDSSCSVPWVRGDFSPPRWIPDGAVPSASSRASALPSRGPTPCCEEEPFCDELYQELCQVGEVIVKFYGLFGGIARSLRLKNNTVAVQDEAWAGRQRESQLTDPPIFWVRGGRVYDFHGDRGTVAEFSQDLLERQVEDDAICRQRRQKQGLMPFPFVAAPLKRDDDCDDQVDGTREAGGGSLCNGGRNLDGRRGSHWK